MLGTPEHSRSSYYQAVRLVYCFGVIHHTPHPERVVQQVRKYLRSGSTLKIVVYHRHSWRVLWILLTYGKSQFWRLHELVARHSEAQTRRPVTYIYSPRAIQELLRPLSSVLLLMRVDHIFPYRIPDYLPYRYRKVWYVRIMPAWLFRWLERYFRRHLCVTGQAR